MEETTRLPTRIHDPVLVYQDPFQTIQKYVAEFGTDQKNYYVSDKGERAAVVPLDQGRILLTRQYRFLINDLSLEVPGGKMDRGESPEAAAIRECLEETGHLCSDLRPILNYHPGLDTHKNYTYIFAARAVRQVEIRPQDSYRWIPREEIFSMISERKIQDSLSLIALLALQAFQPTPLN